MLLLEYIEAHILGQNITIIWYRRSPSGHSYPCSSSLGQVSVFLFQIGVASPPHATPPPGDNFPILGISLSIF